MYSDEVFLPMVDSSGIGCTIQLAGHNDLDSVCLPRRPGSRSIIEAPPPPFLSATTFNCHHLYEIRALTARHQPRECH